MFAVAAESVVAAGCGGGAAAGAEGGAEDCSSFLDWW